MVTYPCNCLGGLRPKKCVATCGEPQDCLIKSLQDALMVSQQ